MQRLSKFLISALLFAVCNAGLIPQIGPNDPTYCGVLLNRNCGSGSVNTAYSNCNLNKNRCECLPTFTGNASVNNPCDCPTPLIPVIPASLLVGFGGAVSSDSLGLGTAVCIDFNGWNASFQNNIKEQARMAKVKTFLQNTVGAMPTQILATQGIPQLQSILDPNVRSRISPAGTFDGFPGVVEYFYGFVANPALNVLSVDLISISCTDYVVGAKANIYIHNSFFARSGGHPPEFWNLTVFGFWTFNPANDLILSIDISVPNLGAVLDIPDSQPGAALIRDGLINATCAVMTIGNGQPGSVGTCMSATDPNINVFGPPGDDPFTAFGICRAAMLSKPFGTKDRLNSDTFTCRALHAQLTPFRPNPHCMHASLSGGGVCRTYDYSEYYVLNGNSVNY